MDVHRYKGSGLLKTLIAGIFLFSPLLSEGVLAASESEQLIVFTQPDVSAVEKSFRKNHLPQIRKIAQAMELFNTIFIFYVEQSYTTP